MFIQPPDPSAIDAASFPVFETNVECAGSSIAAQLYLKVYREGWTGERTKSEGRSSRHQHGRQLHVQVRDIVDDSIAEPGENAEIVSLPPPRISFNGVQRRPIFHGRKVCIQPGSGQVQSCIIASSIWQGPLPGVALGPDCCTPPAGPWLRKACSSAGSVAQRLCHHHFG